MHHNIFRGEVIMMYMKKMIAANKACTYCALITFGAIMGMASAKMLVSHCCCAQKMKKKAKKAFKTLEDKIMDM